MNSTVVSSLAAILTAALLAAVSPASAGNSVVGEVRLVIENKSDEPLRCIAIVAHFLTKEAGTIETGDSHSIDFELYEDGGLAQGIFQGNAVFIENLRCGADTGWTTTSADIPLDLLRESNGATVTAQCRIAPRVTCDMR